MSSGASTGERSPFLTPRWAGRAALLIGSVAALGRIGLWQWHRAVDHGSWQNYGYAVQWWLFAAFAVFLFAKLVLDQLEPGTRAPMPAAAVHDPRPVAPAPAEDDDDELAAYNRRLAWLNERAR